MFIFCSYQESREWSKEEDRGQKDTKSEAACERINRHQSDEQEIGCQSRHQQENHWKDSDTEEEAAGRQDG